MDHNFVASWDLAMDVGAIATVAIAGLIFLYHEFRVMSLKDYKQKYDYVNRNEVRFVWYSIFFLVIAAAFIANAIGTEQLTKSGPVWFGVRIFITISFAVIGYFVFFNLVTIYYPRYVEKRLVKLRNKPRISPEGNLMRKLDEQEEDAHLDASQIAEEANSVVSVDYDVWLDEKGGYKKIEKYISALHAEECSECKFFTSKITREEIEVSPTEDQPGLLLKHYKCGYCGHRTIKEVKLARLSSN